MISIKLNTQGQGNLHEDIEISVGGMLAPEVADSYYFLLSLHEDIRGQLWVSFRNHLLKLVAYISKMSKDEQLYVPISLWDECSSFVAIKRYGESEKCNIYLISTTKEGWSISPWEIGNHEVSQDQIISFKGGVICSIEEVIAGLRQSIDDIKETNDI